MEATKPIVVRIASGDELRSNHIVKNVKFNVQGVRIYVDLYILPLGYDVILGQAWLGSLGKVWHDYPNKSMEFMLGGKKWTWKVLSSKNEEPDGLL